MAARRVPIARAIAPVAALSCLSGGCGSEASPNVSACPGVATHAIHSGEARAPYLALGDDATAAAAILALTNTSGSEVLCTATRIAPGWALTAKHCQRALDQPLVVPVRFSDEAPPVPAMRIHPHAELDLLLLQLAADPS